ncbi:MAG: hypothetical protein ACLGSD_14735 [Acidobacteriota bacterium]
MHEQRSGKVWKWLIAVFVGAFVIFIAMLAAASWMNNQVQDARTTLQEYGDDLIAKKYQEAYVLRDSELQRVLSESEFEKAHESAASPNGKLEKVVLEPTHKVGDRHGMIIVFNSRMIYEHAEDRFVVTMKREGNGWLVHDARFSGN